MDLKKTGNSSDTVIGRGSVVRGVLDIEQNVQVHGVLQGGRLVTEKVLLVGEEGKVEADAIEVGEAVINGQVAGRLRARQRVHMGPHAVFVGQVETPVLVIEEGAVLQEVRPEEGQSKKK